MKTVNISSGQNKTNPLKKIWIIAKNVSMNQSPVNRRSSGKGEKTGRLLDEDDVIDALERQKDKTAKGEIGNFYNTIIQHDIDAIVELPSAQPKQTNCEYCHEDSDGYVTPIEKNCHAFIRFGMNGWELDLSAKGWHGSAKIKYCPMCGRKLKNDK